MPLLLQLSILCDIICALSFPPGDRLAHECSAVDVGDKAYAMHEMNTGSRKKEMTMKADVLSGIVHRMQRIFSVAGRDTGGRGCSAKAPLLYWLPVVGLLRSRVS